MAAARQEVGKATVADTRRYCRSDRVGGRPAGRPQRAKEAILAGDRLWPQACSLTPGSSLPCSAIATLIMRGPCRKPHSSLHLGGAAKALCQKFFTLSGQPVRPASVRCCDAVPCSLRSSWQSTLSPC